MTPRFTVIGARGFIGSHLVGHLRSRGFACATPPDVASVGRDDLGHVLYCAGVTGDVRTRPLDAVRAHVTTLAGLVAAARFDALVYLSSTRVYKRHREAPAAEDDPLVVLPAEFDDLYGLSKLLGEAVAALPAARTHVVRLSNVYGGGFDQPTFLSTVLKDALFDRRVVLRATAAMSRDYVAVADVVDLVTQIAIAGSRTVYNVASGENVTNGEVLDAVARLTGCEVVVAATDAATAVPAIDITRVRREFGAAPRRLLDELPAVVADCRRYWTNHGLDR